MNKRILFFAIGLCLFTGCKKIIDVDIKDTTAQLVIEGNLNDQLGNQLIKITKTVDVGASSIYPPVSGAMVNVSDDLGNNYIFTESSAGSYTYNMKGKPGVTYTMHVKYENKEYTAVSKMPYLVFLDSIGVVTTNIFGKDVMNLAAYFQDPKNEVNQYRFFQYVNDKQSQSVDVRNDALINGNKVREQLFYRSENNDEIKTGDQAVIIMECIDMNMYRYWNSLSASTDRGPNQGTTPSNPPSNISNSALGYFSAHTTQVKSLTVR